MTNNHGSESSESDSGLHVNSPEGGRWSISYGPYVQFLAVNLRHRNKTENLLIHKSGKNCLFDQKILEVAIIDFLVNAEDLYGVCAFDDPNNRTLTGRYEANEDMTIEMCLSICRNDGYPYAGVFLRAPPAKNRKISIYFIYSNMLASLY